jgi:hypothetical protein
VVVRKTMCTKNKRKPYKAFKAYEMVNMSEGGIPRKPQTGKEVHPLTHLGECADSAKGTVKYGGNVPLPR